MILTLNVGLSILDVFEQNKHSKELKGWELNPSKYIFEMGAKAFYNEGKHYYKDLKEKIEDSEFTSTPYLSEVDEIKVISQWIIDRKAQYEKAPHRKPEKLWINLVIPDKMINLTLAEVTHQWVSKNYPRNEVECLFRVKSTSQSEAEPHIWSGGKIQSPEWEKFGNEYIGVVPCTSGLDVLLSRKSKFGVYHSVLGWIE